jgi:hypothetical protein
LKRALLANYLRGVLQLHRIAVEKTYGYRFARTARNIPVGQSEAPIYGVQAQKEELVDEEPDIVDRERFFMGDEDESNPSGRKLKTVVYATMLPAYDAYSDDFDIRQLR